MNTHRLTLALLAAGGFVLSCSESSTEPRPALSAVVIEPLGGYLAPGATLQLAAHGVDVAGARVALSFVTWTTSSSAVATVSDAGLVTAHAKGSATITASSGSKSRSVVVSVAATLASVVIVTPAVMLDLADNAAMVEVLLLDSDGQPVAGPTASWVSTDTRVATVADGVVTPVAVGAARIIASASTFADTVDVSVQRFPIKAVRVSPGSLHVLRGQVVDIVAVPERDGGKALQGRPISWASADPSVVSIDGTGRLTVHAIGTTTVTATSEGVSGSVPVDVGDPALSEVFAVGNSHSCALGVSGSAWCWGANYEGQLGGMGNSGCSWWEYYYNGVTCSFRPLQVVSTSAFRSITAGGSHTCGLLAGGDVVCWGRGTSGELGDGRRRSSILPVTVNSPVPLVRLTAGGRHTCGLTDAGQAFCWGSNVTGQLGTGELGDKLVPTPVLGGHVFTMLSAGDAHSCGVTTAGEVYCWGASGSGQLGSGSSNILVPTPTLVAGLPTARLVTTGIDHTCALSTAGNAFCWGDNRHGELGTGDFEHSLIPLPVATSGTWQEISTRGNVTCGIRHGGGTQCWGGGTYLLFDSVIGNHPHPVDVADGVPFSRLIVGAEHACGLTTGVRVACWGAGYDGAIGNAFWTTMPAPLPILP